ncbi:MAG: NADH-quinone oxidoreductase subunit L, partial [Pseudonocardia sp.]|nr:NADH-quinone oxidoreductase subunit L [Pseudonocardia sp.]
LARLPLAPLALGAAALGVVAEPVRAALGAAGEPHPTLTGALVSGLLSVGVVVAVLLPAHAAHTRREHRQTRREDRQTRREDRQTRRWLLGWLGLGRIAAVGVAGPTMALARALSVFDERVVDGAVWAAAATTRRAARLADLRVEALIAAAVRGLGGTGAALGRLARRPQTGQLHHYYAQAAGALAVLALFLVLVR